MGRGLLDGALGSLFPGIGAASDDADNPVRAHGVSPLLGAGPRPQLARMVSVAATFERQMPRR